MVWTFVICTWAAFCFLLCSVRSISSKCRCVFVFFAGVNQMGCRRHGNSIYEASSLFYSYSYGGLQSCYRLEMICNLYDCNWALIRTLYCFVIIDGVVAAAAVAQQWRYRCWMQFFHYFDWQTSRRIQSRELVAINLWCAIIFVVIDSWIDSYLIYIVVCCAFLFPFIVDVHTNPPNNRNKFGSTTKSICIFAHIQPIMMEWRDTKIVPFPLVSHFITDIYMSEGYTHAVSTAFEPLRHKNQRTFNGNWFLKQSKNNTQNKQQRKKKSSSHISSWWRFAGSTIASMRSHAQMSQFIYVKKNTSHIFTHHFYAALWLMRFFCWLSIWLLTSRHVHPRILFTSIAILP